jgi:hypothetical protein
MILLALALVGVGIWNLTVGMLAVGWACIGMAVLLAYHVLEKYARGDNW